MNDEFLIKFIGGLLLSILMFAVCFTEDKAKHEKVLVNLGYENIEMGERNIVACGFRSSLSNEFKAKLNGKEVNGVVCSGRYQPSIVRTY